ncbi:MAG: hypothetical protein MMC33_004483 [Icmadophila ericetorum]|nr:hypothetical protein [Icmadophila ericetorum]
MIYDILTLQKPSLPNRNPPKPQQPHTPPPLPLPLPTSRTPRNCLLLPLPPWRNYPHVQTRQRFLFPSSKKVPRKCKDVQDSDPGDRFDTNLQDTVYGRYELFAAMERAEITTRHLCRQAWRSTCAEENCILISSLVFGETDWQRPQVPLDVQVENMEDALEESMALHDGEVIDPVDEPRSGDLGR